MGRDGVLGQSVTIEINGEGDEEVIKLIPLYQLN